MVRDMILAHARGDGGKNILITANRGLYASCIAREAAKLMVCTGSRKPGCDCPSCSCSGDHPDISIIKPKQGKTQITVEDVENVLQMTELVPAVGRRRAVIVDGIDRCTAQTANLFLKAMEDREHICFVCIAYSEGVLDTIKSRSATFTLMPYTREEFFSWAERAGVKEPDFWYVATSGCPGLVCEIRDAGAEEAFKKSMAAAAAGDMKELLTVLNLLREKDKDSFFLIHRDLVTVLLAALRTQEVHGEDGGDMKEKSRRIRSLSEAMRESVSGLYTAGDFLNELILTFDR